MQYWKFFLLDRKTNLSKRFHVIVAIDLRLTNCRCLCNYRFFCIKNHGVEFTLFTSVFPYYFYNNSYTVETILYKGLRFNCTISSIQLMGYRITGFFCGCKFLRFVFKIGTCNFCDFIFCDSTPWQSDFHSFKEF